MHSTNPLLRLYFGIVLGLYAFSLVVFDNGSFIALLYVVAGLMTLSFAIYVVVTQTRMRFPLPLLPYAAAVALGAASILWSSQPEFSISRARTLALIVLNLFLVYNIIVHFRNPTGFFIGLYVACAVNLAMALGLIDLNVSRGLDVVEGLRFGGTVNQPNLLGYIGAATLFFAYLHILSVPKRRGSPALKMVEIGVLFMLCAALTAMTFITGSRAAIVVLSMLLVWIVISSVVRPLLAVPLVIAAGGLLAFSQGFGTANITLSGEFESAEVIEMVTSRFETGVENDDDSRDERERLARDAFDTFLAHPLTGTGLGAFEAEQGQYAHNNYADVLSSIGAFGMLLVLAMYGLMIREALLLDSLRLKLAFVLLVGSQMVFDMALVTFTNKFQMLVPFVALACLHLIRDNGNGSIFSGVAGERTRAAVRRRSRRRGGSRRSGTDIALERG